MLPESVDPFASTTESAPSENQKFSSLPDCISAVPASAIVDNRDDVPRKSNGVVFARTTEPRDVIACPALNHVVTTSALERVVPSTSPDRICSLVAYDCVASSSAALRIFDDDPRYTLHVRERIGVDSHLQW